MIAKIQIHITKSSYKKMCKKKLRKNFEKPLKFKWAKTFSKYLKPKCVLKKNWKCANSLQRRLCKSSLQKLCNLVAFPKSYKMLGDKETPQHGNGSKISGNRSNFSFFDAFPRREGQAGMNPAETVSEHCKE